MRGQSMNIISGKNRRLVNSGKESEYHSIVATKIKEMPRCLYPAGIAVYSIPIEKIASNPNSQRRVYTPESIASLAQSIHKYGIIQPITVRTAKTGGYELICGERRLRAVKLLGLRTVNCIVISSDVQRSDAIMLCENMQREELHYFDIAEAVGKLCSKYGFDVESAAAKLCLSERYLSSKLRLLEWSEEQRKKIRDASLSENQAMSLLSVDNAEARDRLLCEVIKSGFDEKSTDELVFAYLKKRLKKSNTRNSTYLIRDIRIFYNTIDRALDVMRHAGYKITADKQDNENYTYITITIPKENA